MEEGEALVAGRLIAFEGVDGAGKSTVLGRVAEHLRGRGQRVFLPRSGKEHDSRPTRMIRRLTRDRRNLELTARSELLLYCARESQVLEQLVRPALARGETVLVDRSLLTPVVLGMARGLSRDECERAAELAAAGLQPDHTLVFDVHPRTSRMRKRIEKVRTHTLAGGGRKGLAGSAFKERVRAAYRSLSVEHGYSLFHVERASPEQLCERVLQVVDGGPGTDAGESALDAHPVWQVAAEHELLPALRQLPLSAALFLSNGLRAAREIRLEALDREPELAAWAMDPEDPLREALVEREPDYALRAWNRRPLSGDDDLRLRLLATFPGPCLRALKHLKDDKADAIREQYHGREPSAVLSSLTGREDPVALSLRARCWEQGEPTARASSLAFCGGQDAWQRRDRLFNKDPIEGLSSLRGVAVERGDELLRAYAPLAPKSVLAALTGRADEAAHALRETLLETGREVVDSVRGLSDERSGELRERWVERWPSTVAHSLLGLTPSRRVDTLRKRCAQLGAGDLHVTRRLAALDERADAPAWVRQRASAELED